MLNRADVGSGFHSDEDPTSTDMTGDDTTDTAGTADHCDDIEVVARATADFAKGDDYSNIQLIDEHVTTLGSADQAKLMIDTEFKSCQRKSPFGTKVEAPDIGKPAIAFEDQSEDDDGTLVHHVVAWANGPALVVMSFTWYDNEFSKSRIEELCRMADQKLSP